VILTDVMDLGHEEIKAVPGGVSHLISLPGPVNGSDLWSAEEATASHSHHDDQKDQEVDSPRWLGFGPIGAGYRIRTKRGVEMEREGQDTERDPIGGGQGGTQGGQ
jgi:hypothetical protein